MLGVVQCLSEAKSRECSRKIMYLGKNSFWGAWGPQNNIKCPPKNMKIAILRNLESTFPCDMLHLFSSP